MVKLNVKKNDMVMMLSGKDKGKRGKILKVLKKEGKVIVEGINVVKKHTKPTQKIRQGGIIEKAQPVPVCAVMLICPHCTKPTKIRRVVEEGKRVRRCKRCGETIDK